MALNHFKRIRNCLPAGVNLLAVSKGHEAASIRRFATFGQIDFGESRVQEALPKLESLNDLKKLRWHFIGHLQANKVRPVVKQFDFIHSIDSFPLAERISRIALEEKKYPSVMFQVKFREDPNKRGFVPEHLLSIWDEIKSLENINIVGLMTMAPVGLGLAGRSEMFKDCRLFADQLLLPHCSMGMSSDWEEAVKAGSTWVRIGSTLFGSRTKAIKAREEM